MKQFRYAVVAVGFVFAVGAPARADDAADARVIIAKAVKAHGGQDKLDKLPGISVKFKGTFHGAGEGIPMSGEVSAQGPDRQRIDIEVEAGGQKIAKDVTEMDKDKLAEAKEQAYAGWVATLAPLKDKQFKLGTIGEIKIE